MVPCQRSCCRSLLSLCELPCEGRGIFWLCSSLCCLLLAAVSSTHYRTTNSQGIGYSIGRKVLEVATCISPVVEHFSAATKISPQWKLAICGLFCLLAGPFTLHGSFCFVSVRWLVVRRVERWSSSTAAHSQQSKPEHRESRFRPCCHATCCCCAAVTERRCSSRRWNTTAASELQSCLLRRLLRAAGSERRRKKHSPR